MLCRVKNSRKLINSESKDQHHVEHLKSISVLQAYLFLPPHKEFTISITSDI